MNNKRFSIDMSSCGLVDPQLQLSAALEKRSLREFCMALDMGADPTVQDEKRMSIFEKVLQTYGCADYVEECLRRDCSPNYINHHLHKAAINFAADSRDPSIFTALLRHRGILVDHKYAQLTPLNALAKNLTAENATDVKVCMQLLLSYGASANLADQREMTPLHHVLKNRKLDALQKRELVELFLNYATDLDVDSCRDGEVRGLLQSEYADLRLPPQRSAADAAAGTSLEKLLMLLRSGEEQKFLHQLDEYQLKVADKDNLVNAAQEQNIQLLMEAIKRGLHAAFDAITKTGVSVNQRHNGNSAAEIAATWGNWSALQKLLDNADLKLRPNDELLLITVIKKLDEPILSSYCDYTKCFFVLLNSGRIDVNASDASGSTPLHYAVKYRNRMAMRELLKRDAYIGQRSAFHDLPIDGIPPELLEDHFDACISTNGLKAGDENFEILMSYKNLMPSSPTTTGPEKSPAQQQLRQEMAPIAFIAESKEHRHLLQHPLITSFLFLKWHRLSLVFYMNFLLYGFFAVSIVVHTLLKFRESEQEALTALFGLFAWIGIAYMTVRELLQIAMSPRQYFRSPINLLEIALIVLAVMTCAEPSYDRETQRVVAVLTMLLVALELCLLVGSLPVLSISTHMLMLRAVSTSFLKSFALYSIFVITFSLCFYILFGKPEMHEAVSPAPDENGDFNKFANPFAAVIKTIVMLTGEFDAGDIDFDTLYSYLVFLLFVVFMSIVLFNLLNGLAVSDTQAIKAQAELNGSICRTQLLTRYEQVLTGRSGRATFIVQHEPFRSICRRLLNLYPNYIAGCQVAILPNDGNKVLIPLADSHGGSVGRTSPPRKDTALQPLAGSDNQESQKKLLDPPVRFLPCCCSCITGRCSQMDRRTVKLAMAVVEQKTAAQRERQRQQSTERRLQSIEEKVNKMFELLQEMKSK